ncbi:MAG: N-acetylmuramoyl-L-alanine amidase [Armatimonadota bacterium]
MRTACFIFAAWLLLSAHCLAAASTTITSLEVRSGEITITLSSPSRFEVQRARYPDQLVIALPRCRLSESVSLSSISAPWFDRVQADATASGELRLRFLLRGTSRPEVFAPPRTNRIVITPGRTEHGYAPALPPPDNSEVRTSSEASDGQPARPQPVSERPAVTEFAYEPTSPTSGRLLISLSGAVRPQVFFLKTDPARPRLVVDLPGASISRLSVQPPDNELVKLVRSGPFNDGARVVLDAAGPLSYSVTTEAYPYRVVVEVRRADPPPLAASLEPNAGGTTRPLTISRPAGMPRQLQGLVVVVDPGHGGSQKGAVGPNGLCEKDVNLDIALRLKRILLDAGANPVLTREDDSTLADLSLRPLLANQLGAAVFISIHCNSNPGSSKLRGTETYYHMQNPISRSLAACIQRGVTGTAGTNDRGIRSDSIRFPRSGFAVLRGASVPAVLVEVAYINNPDDERLLSDPGFRQRVAEGILAGLRLYIEGDAVQE